MPARGFQRIWVLTFTSRGKSHDMAIYMNDAPSYFDNVYEDEWIEDPFVKEMIQDVDSSTVISAHIIESPIFFPVMDDFPCIHNLNLEFPLEADHVLEIYGEVFLLGNLQHPFGARFPPMRLIMSICARRWGCAGRRFFLA